MKILIVNGPNMNLLGKREPDIYGKNSLDTINKELIEYKDTIDKAIELEFFQSNHEGEIIDKIQNTDANGIIINPAGYTHTSIALGDCIKGVNIPTVEVHLSNINAREEYRKISKTASSCIGQISGFQKDSYKLALIGLYNYLKTL